MTVIKTREIASIFGGLDEDALIAGTPMHAHILRELARQGNRCLAKGDLMFRYVTAAHEPFNIVTDPIQEFGGWGSMFAPPYWQSMLPAMNIQVPKKPGLTHMRVKMRLWITLDYQCEVFVATSMSPSPYVLADGDNPPNLLPCVGYGDVAAYTFEDIPVNPEAAYETLSFYIRQVIDPATDDPYDPATQGNGDDVGTAGSGSYANIFIPDHGGTAWSVASIGNPYGTVTVHNTGNYVLFYSNESDELLHRALIVGCDELALYIYPPFPESAGLQMRGSAYEIYNCAKVRVASIAAYSKEIT